MKKAAKFYYFYRLWYNCWQGKDLRVKKLGRWLEWLAANNCQNGHNKRFILIENYSSHSMTPLKQSEFTCHISWLRFFFKEAWEPPVILNVCVCVCINTLKLNDDFRWLTVSPLMRDGIKATVKLTHRNGLGVDYVVHHLRIHTRLVVYVWIFCLFMYVL